jgi:hypothetical protein
VRDINPKHVRGGWAPTAELLDPTPPVISKKLMQAKKRKEAAEAAAKNKKRKAEK